MKKILLPALLFAMLFLSHFQILAAEPNFLQLVNKANPLSSDYKPSQLCQHNGIYLHSAARDAFTEMLSQMQNDGIHGLKLQSAYRSYEYQAAVFNQRIKELMANGNNKQEATTLAAKSVQPPGSSEHQLGLALDVSIDGTLTQDFGNTPAGIWLAEKCHHFGFVIRYPAIKTDITQIVYEPWHLRYVGIPHSHIMKEQGLTLEEYWGFLQSIHAYVHWLSDSEYYLVSYTNANIITEHRKSVGCQ